MDIASNKLVRQRRKQASDPIWRFIPRLEGTSSRVISVLTADGTIRYQSPPLKWILGFEPERLVGRSLFTFLHAKSRDGAREAIRRMVEDGEQFGHWKLCFRAASGNYQWLEGMASNFLQDPRLEGIVIYWREMYAKRGPCEEPAAP